MHKYATSIEISCAVKFVSFILKYPFLILWTNPLQSVVLKGCYVVFFIVIQILMEHTVSKQ